MSLLLESKFFRPRPRHDVILRQRLLYQLHLGLQRKLILVLAQAGFGKSTLVSQWLNTLEPSNANQENTPRYQVAWLSLDENDNDPLRFFDYLITALQRANPTVGQQARYLLSAPQPPSTLDPLVVSIIHDLMTLSDPLILALDDYHTISAPEVHHAIRTLISHAPDRFHLMIISRTEPPLPLTRWRIYQELTEIRESDLRFTLDEALIYLLETMHCTISRAEVAALEERTEGWIVGLHLAALSLQSNPNAATFIADFTGSHAYIVDYLTEEVLQRQPTEIQEFLFQTALFTRFCAPLCDAVLGRTGSQALLEYLERSHLFVVSLDNERGWYRYHHLFAEMLRRRAQEHKSQRDRAARADSYRRAAQWHLQQGLVLEAIEYALSSEDGDYAAALIESNLQPLVAHGHFFTLRQWLNRLPPATLAARPKLCATRARVAMRQHKLDEAEKWLDATLAALAIVPDPALETTGEAHALRVDLALNRGRIAETIQLASEALEMLPVALIHPRSEILFFQSIAYYWDDQYAKAVASTTQAAELAARAGDILTALSSWANLARFLHTQGKLREAMAALDQTWAFAQQHNAHLLPLMGSYHNNRAEISYEWNLFDAAEENFLRAIELSEQMHNPRTLLRSYSLMIPLYRARGMEAEAETKLQQARTLMRQVQLPRNIVDECSRTIIRKRLDEGNLVEVEEWLKTRGVTIDSAALCETHALEPEYLLVARYLALQNHVIAAVDLLAKCAESTRSVGKLTTYIAIQSYHALLLQQIGESRGATRLLAEVLAIAEPQNFIRTFLDEGAPLQRLLLATQPTLAPQLRSYASRLLEMFAQASPPTAAPMTTPIATQTATLPTSGAPGDTGEFVYAERLSERELEVLRLVNEGLSDSQIATRLVLATGTVKRHLNNIYGKLGVHTRTHALARARSLRLL